MRQKSTAGHDSNLKRGPHHRRHTRTQPWTESDARRRAHVPRAIGHSAGYSHNHTARRTAREATTRPRPASTHSREQHEDPARATTTATRHTSKGKPGQARQENQRPNPGPDQVDTSHTWVHFARGRPGSKTQGKQKSPHIPLGVYPFQEQALRCRGTNLYCLRHKTLRAQITSQSPSPA